MLDIKFIRENPEVVKTAIQNKGMKLDVDLILTLDKEVLELKTKTQDLQEKRNAHSKKIPKASAEERPILISQGKDIGKELDALKPLLTEKEQSLWELVFKTPTIPSPEAPIGKDDKDNVVLRKEGEVPTFSFKPLDHVEILEKHKWAEFEKIAEISGSRSYSLRDDMMLLELALHRFALDKLKDKGFTLVSTPSLAREHALVGTGHFPAGKDQVYHLPEDDLYLSGTSEVQLNSLHSKEIMSEADLPIFYAGYSPCFRREAGSYGRDVRGLIRVHQFQKVEQFVICKNDPKESEKLHKMLLETSEEIVRELELPYQIIECCTGDMGTGKYRMFDIECWVPSEEVYRETHSCSSLLDWQARRTNTRYRDEDGKVQFCHTLNNTAIATPRVLVPIIENHQQEDGSVRLPEAIRKYMGGVEFIGLTN